MTSEASQRAVEIGLGYKRRDSYELVLPSGVEGASSQIDVVRRIAEYARRNSSPSARYRLVTHGERLRAEFGESWLEAIAHILDLATQRNVLEGKIDRVRDVLSRMTL